MHVQINQEQLVMPTEGFDLLQFYWVEVDRLRDKVEELEGDLSCAEHEIDRLTKILAEVDEQIMTGF